MESYPSKTSLPARTVLGDRVSEELESIASNEDFEDFLAIATRRVFWKRPIELSTSLIRTDSTTICACACGTRISPNFVDVRILEYSDICYKILLKELELYFARRLRTCAFFLSCISKIPNDIMIDIVKT